MTSTVTELAATQTFFAPTDTLSTSTGIANLCGSYTYTITQAYPFLTINQTTRVLTLQTNDMTKIGSHPVTLSASLTSYPAVAAVTKTFTATFVDPCLTTTLTLPTVMLDFSLVYGSGA